MRAVAKSQFGAVGRDADEPMGELVSVHAAQAAFRVVNGTVPCLREIPLLMSVIQRSTVWAPSIVGRGTMPVKEGHVFGRRR